MQSLCSTQCLVCLVALRAPPTACCLRGRPLVLKPQKSRGRRGSLHSVGLSQSAPSRGCSLPWGHQGWPEGRGIPRLESNLQSITLLSLLLHIQSLSGGLAKPSQLPYLDLEKLWFPQKPHLSAPSWLRVSEDPVLKFCCFLAV